MSAHRCRRTSTSTAPSRASRNGSPGSNRMTNAAFIQFLNVTPGSRVLEVGSGLGILAGDVAAAADESTSSASSCRPRRSPRRTRNRA